MLAVLALVLPPSIADAQETAKRIWTWELSPTNPQVFKASVRNEGGPGNTAGDNERISGSFTIKGEASRR